MEDKLQSQRVGALASAKSHADHALRRALHWGDASFGIEIPREGNSLVYHLHPEGHPGVALLAIKKRREALKLDAALRAAAPRGAPIPKLLHTDVRILPRLVRGHYFVATSLLPGVPLRPDERDESTLIAMARALSRLHAIQDPHWGKPGHPRHDSLLRAWSTEVERIMRRFIKDSALSGFVPEMHVFFRRVIERMEEPSQFQLCHHHIAPEDMLYDAATDSVSLTDCGHMEFSRAARDLASVRWECFPDAEESFDLVLQNYFRGVSKTAREQYLREREFFEAFHHLRKIQRYPRDAKGNLPIALTRLRDLIERCI